ncbi:PspC domain-containing protein [Maribacter sp. 2307UL18-2]|uniref:PspC domain-containing protein n=1 Tax=Maribacter sp. 2307UL18-2 TaxID=3386274 RepID=UPI0039BC8022
MNKTVNINLANVLFHIDEDAYTKMRRYLESVKRSFANTPGSDEILADIEARIAELFHEKLADERQVITQKEVDEVISIMGQPEDYMVDEDIFEDEPRPRTEPRKSKKLYRDIETKYIGGVCSGLEHYLGFDALWIRIIFILLGVFTGFGFIAYILLWILVPEAATTSQKLDMKGEAVNIDNIQRKVKEGFDDVADKVKNADYSKVKSTGKSFFDTIGDIIMFFFKVFGKFIGILLIIIGAATIIGMFVGLLTVGTLDWFHLPGLDGAINSITGAPIWLISLLVFFAVGIPFFFLLYLGLKILVSNLKSIGNIAKFSLLGLWLISIITLIVLGVREAASHAFTGSVSSETPLYLENESDTLNFELASSEFYDSEEHIRMNDMILIYDDEGKPTLQSEDVRFNIKKTNDTVVLISVRKEANGPSFQEARQTAERINYGYTQRGNTVYFDNYLTTQDQSKFNDQEVRVNLYLPEGQHIAYNPSNRRNWTIRAQTDKAISSLEDYLWKMRNDGVLECQNCPDEFEEDAEDGDNRIRINGEGIDININDEDGESFKMKINEDGVRIKAKDNDDEKVDINIDSQENVIKIEAQDGDTTMRKTISKN